MSRAPCAAARRGSAAVTERQGRLYRRNRNSRAWPGLASRTMKQALFHLIARPTGGGKRRAAGMVRGLARQGRPRLGRRGGLLGAIGLPPPQLRQLGEVHRHPSMKLEVAKRRCPVPRIAAIRAFPMGADQTIVRERCIIQDHLLSGSHSPPRCNDNIALRNH